MSVWPDYVVIGHWSFIKKSCKKIPRKFLFFCKNICNTARGFPTAHPETIKNALNTTSTYQIHIYLDPWTFWKIIKFNKPWD
jgi:hypothetical protein